MARTRYVRAGMVLAAMAAAALVAMVWASEGFTASPQAGPKCSSSQLKISGTAERDKLFGTVADECILGRDLGDDLTDSVAYDYSLETSDQDVDTVLGGRGADRIDIADGDGWDYMSCGPGKDEFNAIDQGDVVDDSCEAWVIYPRPR